jgi:hypothetical protein
LQRRVEAAEAALSAVMNDWALKKSLTPATLANISRVLEDAVPF